MKHPALTAAQRWGACLLRAAAPETWRTRHLASVDHGKGDGYVVAAPTAGAAWPAAAIDREGQTQADLVHAGREGTHCKRRGAPRHLLSINLRHPIEYAR